MAPGETVSSHPLPPKLVNRPATVLPRRSVQQTLLSASKQAREAFQLFAMAGFDLFGLDGDDGARPAGDTLRDLAEDVDALAEDLLALAKRYRARAGE